MLDTLTPNFAPQLQDNAYLRLVQQMMAAHRAADGYELALRVVPDASNIAIAPNGTYEGKFTVPDRSRLWAISGSSSEAAGFDLQIRNASVAQPLFGRRVDWRNATGQTLPTDSPASGLFVLPRPLLLLSPNPIAAVTDCPVTVQIWNRAAAVNTVQLVLWFMVPEVRNDRN